MIINRNVVNMLKYRIVFSYLVSLSVFFLSATMLFAQHHKVRILDKDSETNSIYNDLPGLLLSAASAGEIKVFEMHFSEGQITDRTQITYALNRDVLLENYHRKNPTDRLFFCPNRMYNEGDFFVIRNSDNKFEDYVVYSDSVIIVDLDDTYLIEKTNHDMLSLSEVGFVYNNQVENKIDYVVLFVNMYNRFLLNVVFELEEVLQYLRNNKYYAFMQDNPEGVENVYAFCEDYDDLDFTLYKEKFTDGKWVRDSVWQRADGKEDRSKSTTNDGGLTFYSLADNLEASHFQPLLKFPASSNDGVSLLWEQLLPEISMADPSFMGKPPVSCSAPTNFMVKSKEMIPFKGPQSWDWSMHSDYTSRLEQLLFSGDFPYANGPFDYDDWKKMSFSEWDSQVYYSSGEIVLRYGVPYQVIAEVGPNYDPEFNPDVWEKFDSFGPRVNSLDLTFRSVYDSQGQKLYSKIEGAELDNFSYPLSGMKYDLPLRVPADSLTSFLKNIPYRFDIEKGRVINMMEVLERKDFFTSPVYETNICKKVTEGPKQKFSEEAIGAQYRIWKSHYYVAEEGSVVETVKNILLNADNFESIQQNIYTWLALDDSTHGQVSDYVDGLLEASTLAPHWSETEEYNREEMVSYNGNYYSCTFYGDEGIGKIPGMGSEYWELVLQKNKEGLLEFYCNAIGLLAEERIDVNGRVLATNLKGLVFALNGEYGPYPLDMHIRTEDLENILPAKILKKLKNIDQSPYRAEDYSYILRLNEGE